jgi:hypothetical protein
MSIKRKFATAVATASLLAGLFGSALVSTASAAGRIGPSGTVSIGKSDISAGGDIAETVDSADTKAKDFYWNLDANVEALEVSNSIDYEFNSSTNADITRVQELSATSSSSLIKVAWAADGADGVFDDTCAAIDNGSGNISAGFSTDVVEGAEAADGVYHLCIESNGNAGKATITVKADGVTLPAVTVTTLGDLATLTLSVTNGHNYVAQDNDSVDKYFTVVGKDSAGQTLNAGGNGAYYDDGVDVGLDAFGIMDSAENPSFANDETPSVVVTGAELSGANFALGSAYNRYDLDTSVCLEDDAGKAYAIAVEGVNSEGDTITSNTVSITCTGDEAKVTDLSVEATGGAKKYNETGIYQNDELSILATIVDQANRPMGVGVTVNFDVSIDADSDLGAFAITTDIDFVGEKYNGAPLGNKVRVGYLEPDVALKAVYPYAVTLGESDLGADESVTYSEDFTYTVDASVVEKTYTISSVRNAAKTRSTMTVNFGAECSRKLVDFDVQLANGDVKYLTRRANAAGVATLIMERRNTKIYVQAFCGGSALTGYDLESELRGVRFR